MIFRVKMFKRLYQPILVASGLLVLILSNAWWDAIGLMTGQMRPSTVSLFVNVLASLFFLSCVNEGVGLFRRRLFRTATLLRFYVALSVASAVFGLDLLQPLLSVIAHPVWFAGEGNDWNLTVVPHLPSGMIVWDKSSLRGFYTGLSSFNRWDVLSGWMAPLTWWGLFLLNLGGAMVCLSASLFPFWKQARLSYPIAQIPLRFLSSRHNLLHQRAFWLGFGIAGFVNLFNGLHFLYPTVPSLGGWLLDLSPFFPNRPLNAIGWTPITVLPFGIGLGFVMPLDLLLSSWVFYLGWKAERVLSAMTGWWALPRFPYLEEQQFGAYLAFALLALAPIASIWNGRGYKARPPAEIRRLFYQPVPPAQGLTVNPATDRWLIGFFVCCLFLLVLVRSQGATLWLAGLFFIGYFLVSVAIARIRAQLGSPVHDLHFAGPDRTLVYIIGSRNLTPKDLTILSLFGGFNRAYRGHPMPHILEGIWLASELMEEVVKEPTGIRSFREAQLLAAGSSLIGWIAGYLFGTWSLLTASYRFGGRPWYGSEVFRQLDSYLHAPSSFGWASLLATLWGGLQVFLLSQLHLRFNFPLHPAGFVVSGSWSINLFWVSLAIAWIVKVSIVRWLGLTAHRNATPFFIGLVSGDYVAGSMWSLWGCWKGRPAYNFLP